MPATTPSSVSKLLGQFRASPVRGLVLSLLVVLLVGLWIRLLSGGHVPSSAGAAPITSAARASAQADFPAPRHFAVESSSLRNWARMPIVPPQRNLFAVPLDYYPRDGTAPAPAAAGQDGFWDHLAKSLSAQADQLQQRQALIDNTRMAAGALKVQSILLGAQPKAMVNGEMVREGGVIAGFRVLKIESRQIIVQRDGIELAILME